MRTMIRTSVQPAGSIFTGESMSTMGDEIDFRMRRLASEADRARLVGTREGLRQHVGHALMALGRAIHGLEPETATRTGHPALDAR